MQLALDELYAASVKGQRFCNLVELIKRPENIKLAYRNIRKNSGSRTAGVDNKTISDLNKWNENALVAHVQRKLDWYVPKITALRSMLHRKENVPSPVWNWKQSKWTVTTKSHWCLGAMTATKT